MQTKKATASASSNIAFIKYWGKKDEEKIIPMNTSVSMTLRDSVSTTTTVTFSSQFPKDTLVLGSHSNHDGDNSVVMMAMVIPTERTRSSR